MTTDRPVLLGRVLMGLVAAFLVVASIAPKLAGAAAARDSFVALGWAPEFSTPIGVLELALVGLYLLPRTRLLGLALLTALLGGAVAAHLRVGSPLLSHTLFGVYLGVIAWVGVLLVDPALRRQFPLRRP